MVDNIQNAVVYLFPGFLAYALVYRLVHGGESQSDLMVTAKSVLWSLAISVPVLVWGKWRGYEVGWTEPGTVVWLFVIAIVSGVFVTVAELRWQLTDGFAQIIARWGRSPVWCPVLWRRIFNEFREHEGLMVFVQMSDGTTFYGALRQISSGPDGEMRELLLESTWMYTKEGEREEIGRPIYLFADAISAIVFGPTGEEARTTPQA